MVNRKGFISIVEMMIAVALIATMILIAYKQTIPAQNIPDVNEIARDILKDIGSQEILRTEVLGQQTNAQGMTQTLTFVNSSLPDYILFELRSCDVSNACGQSTYRGNVYSAERIISADTATFNPIKLRLFLWVNE